MDDKKLMKKCSDCKIEKDYVDFSKNKSRKDGFQNTCISCNKIYIIKNKEKIKEKKKIYYDKNKELILSNKKEYHINNRERILKTKKEYDKNNREKINASFKIYTNKRKLIDPLYKLSCNIRTLIGMSIKGNGFTKKSKTCEYLGCSFEEFKKHIESKFSENMNWENRKEWHLDHIYPVSLAKDEQHLIKLNHYTNFQPLWAIDNIKKGNKII
jgi:hypothetical protein